MPWFDTRLGHLRKGKSIHLIYVLYEVKSVCYTNRTSFTSYIVEAMLPMILRMTSSGNRVRGCPGSISGWVTRNKKDSSYIG